MRKMLAEQQHCMAVIGDFAYSLAFVCGANIGIKWSVDACRSAAFPPLENHIHRKTSR
jgi:hypothetical protein